MRRPAAAAASVATAAAILISGPALGQGFFSDRAPCGNIVPRELAKAGVPGDDVATTLTEENWSHSNEIDVFQGWTVWLGLKSCEGRLVIRLAPSCTVETVYTTGQCRIGDLYHSG